ncbi:alpha-1D adrenergic receptor-like [Physella acuta]|uniref:alpha-1D adrenergic receptor-like n=1 Tax=Physella acuta TaxID=109671 RepID=UPI0027DD82FE|nr:alpha-1D adrenergic receptor-like [Physella acuta]
MEAISIVYITAEIIVGVLSVFGNAVVVAAIWRTRRLHTVTNTFVGSLALADIVVGVLVAPCAALSFKGLPSDFYGCVFINSAILIFTNVSILMLLAVALERFLAIKEPFLYQRLLTVRRAVYINIVVWILGFLLGLVPLYGWNAGYAPIQKCEFTKVITYEYLVYFQFFGLVLLPLFIMLCIYIYILIIVRRHMRQTTAIRNLFQHRAQDGFNKDVKAAKMLALVILLFGLFWLPVNIFNCLKLFCPDDCYYPYEALLTAIVMSHANSCINPFLYAASNSRIKRAIKEIFGLRVPAGEFSTDNNHMRHTNGVSPNGDRTNSPPGVGRINGGPPAQPFTISNEEFLKLNTKQSLTPATPEADVQENMSHKTPTDLDVSSALIEGTIPQNDTRSELIDTDDSDIKPDMDEEIDTSETVSNTTIPTLQHSRAPSTSTVSISLSKPAHPSKNGIRRSFHLPPSHLFHTPVKLTSSESRLASLSKNYLQNGHVNFAYVNDDARRKRKDAGENNDDDDEEENLVQAFTVDAEDSHNHVVITSDSSDSDNIRWCVECDNGLVRSEPGQQSDHLSGKQESPDYKDIDDSDTGGQFTKINFLKRFHGDGPTRVSTLYHQTNTDDELELQDLRQSENIFHVKDLKKKNSFVLDLCEDGSIRNPLTEHTKL